MVVDRDNSYSAHISALFLPVALLLGLPACSVSGDDDLDNAQGADGGFDDGGATSGQGGLGDDDDDDDDDGGTGGGDDGWGDDDDDDDGDDDDDEEMPDDPPDECNAEDLVTLYLSPDDSNSMSSPVQAREAILDNFSSLGKVAIRTWEFLNYYTFDYEAAADPGAIALYTDLTRKEGADEGQYVMQIGVASEEIRNADRDPVSITLVLDTSGSMQGLAMDMLKETCFAIASSLKEGDKISMVTWDTTNSLVLGGYNVAGPDDETVVGECEGLEAGGGTDLHGGLTAGYELAQEVFQPGMINRIVLVSDGGANAGITDIDLIAQHAGEEGADGIYMVGVGVGEASDYNDDLMDEVTDAGKGASVFVSNTAEAYKMFSERFVSTMGVAARDVQVRLDMPPGFEVVKFSGEEISGDPSEVEPQHLAPSDAMVFHQEIATCAPELVDNDSEFTVTVSYQDASTFESREVSQTFTFGEMAAADHSLLLKGAAIFEYAETLKRIKDGDEDLTPVQDALQAAEAANPEDADLAEIRTVVGAL